MNTIIANICGVAAVAMFVFSYQLKNRNGLILVNALSRVLYVLQYILLGAWEGAVLDVVALLVTVLAQQKDRNCLKKHTALFIMCANLFIIGSGMALYQNIFSLLPIAGVIFETGALWLNKEKHIRILSVFGAPCWLAYNLIYHAYGSAAGNLMTIVSICLAIWRHDLNGKKKEP